MCRTHKKCKCGKNKLNETYTALPFESWYCSSDQPLYRGWLWVRISLFLKGKRDTFTRCTEWLFLIKNKKQSAALTHLCIFSLWKSSQGDQLQKMTQSQWTGGSRLPNPRLNHTIVTWFHSRCNSKWPQHRTLMNLTKKAVQLCGVLTEPTASTVPFQSKRFLPTLSDEPPLKASSSSSSIIFIGLAVLRPFSDLLLSSECVCKRMYHTFQIWSTRRLLTIYTFNDSVTSGYHYYRGANKLKHLVLPTCVIFRCLAKPLINLIIKMQLLYMMGRTNLVLSLGFLQVLLDRINSLLEAFAFVYLDHLVFVRMVRLQLLNFYPGTKMRKSYQSYDLLDQASSDFK